VVTHAQFDTFGNQRKVWDGLGNYTTTDFDTTYYAFPVQVTSPVPDSTGDYGSDTAFVTSATFDPVTRLPLTTTDANGVVTEITYDEDTLRPLNTKTYYDSVQIGATAETVYHDESGNYWVKNGAQIDADHWAETITYFDGLGRAWKTEEVNSEGNIFVEKEFDSEGRVSRVTNPFRTGETKKWTTNVYDDASRVIEIDLPDGSDINTDYGVSTSGVIGVTKQITDQAGKKRKGITDALGNMVKVIEDPTGQNLATDYVFDTLGNLRRITQGGQYRYFYHSSLGRLLYAKQPEQNTNTNLSVTDPITGNTAWSVKYEYDDNGNIVSTTDAKNSTVTATYDDINRIIFRNYSETATPDVTFYYDGSDVTTPPAFSKGQATKISSSVSATRFMTFDEFGRVKSHRQTTDGNNYDTAYSYNLSGALIEETYPSTRVVKYTLDQDGDLSQVQSRKTSAQGFWTYAGSFSFDSAGNVTKLQLGNGLWETAAYNDRLQIKEIGLGITNTSTSLLRLEYKYDTTTTSFDNNGSLREQKITVPGITNPFIQTLTYDDLNRLESATETNNSTQTWKQTFTIDRYGNRKFNTTGTNTTTLGSCPAAECNPEASQSDNRYTTTDGYTYDPNGSLTENAKGERFTYDMENHQTEFFEESNSGSTPDATYYYDGDGKRVKKVTGTEVTIFVYNAGGTLVEEYSTELAATQQVSYLTQDHLGSPRVITNESGVVKDREDFTAFGEEVVSSQRTSNSEYSAADQLRQNYTGYEKDGESGLEFAQARYYNPGHGRFTSVDPLTSSASIKNPQTFNRYSYVLNSPYKFSDPLGLLPLPSGSGACGGACQNSDGGAGSGALTGGAYDSGYRNGPQMLAMERQAALTRQTARSAVRMFGYTGFQRTGSFFGNESVASQPAEESAPADTCSIRTVSKPGNLLNSVTSTMSDPTRIGPKTDRNEDGELTGAQYTFQVEAEVSGNPSEWTIEQQVYLNAQIFNAAGRAILEEVGPRLDDAPEVPSNIFKGRVGNRNLVNWADSPGPLDFHRQAIFRGHFAINGVSRVRKGNIVCSIRWSIVQTFGNGVVTRNQFNPGRYVILSDYGGYEP
jgi:RHS repeat-associated protein